MGKLKVGVVGGAGMTGGELLRLLANHPEVEVTSIHSRSQAGNPVAQKHTDLIGDTDLLFSDTVATDVDVIFLCLGHGESAVFMENNDIPESVRIIDLSQDFRLGEGIIEGRTAFFGEREFVYGLPELQRDRVKSASNIANPGCFATAIQLALLPLAANGELKNEIHVSAITGSTGAGLKLMETTAFSWRNNNVSTYKVFRHQHLNEIGQSARQLQEDFNQPVRFVPYRGNFSRGILASVYITSDLTEEQAVAMFKEYYADASFTHVIDKNVDLKLIVNTNKCFIKVEKIDDTLFITSAIDNLLKGAVGQAVQNMNLMFGLPEDLGLRLKPIAF